MKKIAFIMATPFTYGGEQRVVSTIANLFNEKEYETTIICTDLNKVDYSLYNLSENVKIEDCSAHNFFSKTLKRITSKIRKINSNIGIISKFPNFIKFLYFTPYIRRKIIKTINENNYDYVVGVSNEYFMFLAGYRNKINSNIKIIAWQHNNFEAYFNKKGQRLFKKYCNNFDNYVVLMNDDKNKMKEHFNIECTKIFNPLSLENPMKSTLKNEKFIWFGRIHIESKGLDILLKAYNQYITYGGTWKLQIVGDGKEKKDVIKLVQELNLNDMVEFVGFTNNIAKYIKEASIMLCPSRWEGFGLVVTESMQCGLPIICFDLNPFKEISENYDSCCFIKQFDIDEFAKKMYEISKDKEKIMYMSKEALKNVEKFKKEQIINEWVNMLNKKEVLNK